MKLLPIGYAVACAAGLWACAAEPDAAPEELAAATPHVVDLTTTEYALSAPDTIAAGWTTFRMANRGEELHYGHIVRLDPGHTVDRDGWRFEPVDTQPSRQEPGGPVGDPELLRRGP